MACQSHHPAALKCQNGSASLCRETYYLRNRSCDECADFAICNGTHLLPCSSAANALNCSGGAVTLCDPEYFIFN